MMDRITRLRVGLLLAVLFLLPFGSLPELPILLAALFGLHDTWRAPQPRLDAAAKLWSVVFLGYWLPELISAVDSVAPSKSWLEVASDLRFFPFGYFVLRTMQRSGAPSMLLRGAAIIVLFWALDALVQALFGRSLGGMLHADRLSGIFSDDNLKLGPVMAVLAALPLCWFWQRQQRLLMALSWLLLALVILLAGARAAWLGFALVTLLMLWHIASTPRRFWTLLAASLVLGALVFAGAWFTSERMQARVQQSLAALKGTEAGLDQALAHRMPIWRASAQMIASHPINGVGVRAFRYAYAENAQSNDIWLTTPTGHAAHAHQIILEILTETGVLGLLCWLTALGFLVRAWRHASKLQRTQAWPWALALITMCFPLNTHLAFYSNFWGGLFFWLLTLLIGTLSARDAHDVTTPVGAVSARH